MWLASDEDREGEAIAWHLFEVLGLKAEHTKRIVFHEITKDAILHAIEHPRDIDRHLVDAQQARRVLDRLVGFEVSPVLWKKVKPSLSAGRVQSVAVKLIVEREREINAFKEQGYYRVTGLFRTPEGVSLQAEAQERFGTREETERYLEACRGAVFTVKNVETKPTVRKPAPPFTTSTLQQEASRKLGFSVSQTMTAALDHSICSAVQQRRIDWDQTSDERAVAAGLYSSSGHHSYTGMDRRKPSVRLGSLPLWKIIARNSSLCCSTWRYERYGVDFCRTGGKFGPSHSLTAMPCSMRHYTLPQHRLNCELG